MTSIVSRTAAYASSLDFAPPVEGAIYYNLFQGTGARVLTRNLATGGVGANVVGTITKGAAYAEFGGSTGYLQTDQYETDDVTVISACWCPDVDLSGVAKPVYIGAFNPYGFSLQRSSATQDNANASFNLAGDVTQNRTAVAAGTVDTWAFLVGIGSAAGSRIVNLTTDLDVSSAAPTEGAPRKPSANPFRIGYGYAVTGGAHRQFMAAIYPRVLTDTEIATIYASVQEIADPFGIVI